MFAHFSWCPLLGHQGVENRWTHFLCFHLSTGYVSFRLHFSAPLFFHLLLSKITPPLHAPPLFFFSPLAPSSSSPCFPYALLSFSCLILLPPGSAPLILNPWGVNTTFDISSSWFDTTPQGNERRQREWDEEGEEETEEKEKDEEGHGYLTDALNAAVFKSNYLISVTEAEETEQQCDTGHIVEIKSLSFLYSWMKSPNV